MSPGCAAWVRRAGRSALRPALLVLPLLDIALDYEAATVPVAHAPGAECLTVVDGRITQMRIIFDRLPFDAARRAAAST